MQNRRRRGQSGIAIYITTAMLVMIIPTIGLTVDGSLLYIIRTRMQGACDGAALAATRALARGTNSAAQITNAQNDAAIYVKLNFPSSFFFSGDVQIDPTTDVTVDLGQANLRVVTVNAHVTEPTLFMRWLSEPSTIVRATATATRRDVNISMVVDRSGSLSASGSCGAVKQAAINFVNKFSDGRDNVSLVTFAASTHVDFPINVNFKSAGTPVPTILSNIVCAGSTSSAMSLWYGYDQLVGLNQPGALNVLLFFTDGKPTGVNVNMPIAGTSGCTNAHPGAGGAPNYINGLYNTYTNVNQFFGILKPIGTGTPPDDTTQVVTPDGNSGANCAFAAGWNGNVTNTSDFLGVPLTDVFGDSLNNGYQAVTTVGACPGVTCFIDINNPNNAGAMPMNAADDAATRIRNGATEPSTLPQSGKKLNGVTIFSIGLGNAPYPLSPGLLKRISNDPTSDIYSTSQSQGLFVSAPTAADIDEAFTKVASEVLRLAK